MAEVVSGASPMAEVVLEAVGAAAVDGRWIVGAFAGVWCLSVVVVAYILLLHWTRTPKTQPENAQENAAAVCLKRSPSTLLAAASAGGQLWEVGKRGFLPARAPLRESRHAELRVLGELAAQIPAACIEHTMRALIWKHEGRLKVASAFFANVDDEEELELANALYSYIVNAWAQPPKAAEEAPAVQRGCCPHRQVGLSPAEKQAVTLTVPACLARGFAEVALRLGRRPMLDYAGCVLYNWELIEESRMISASNVRMLRRFTGLVDEEWFFKTHLVIEAAAAPAVAAVADGLALLGAAACGEARACVSLLDVLHRVEHCFGRVVRDCLPLMFERDDDHGALCDYYFFYNRLRPFISGFEELKFENEFDGEALRLPGPSGAMSTLLPTLDAFLGVSNSNAALEKLLDDFALSMPTSHRTFLEALRSSRLCVRTAILAAVKVAPEHGVLAIAYDRCIDVVLDFRWRHLQMVRKYVLEPSGNRSAVGTGGTSAFEYLHEHISDTEAAKLGRKKAPQGSPPTACAAAPPPPPPLSLHADDVDDVDALWAVSAVSGFLPRKPPANWDGDGGPPHAQLAVLARLVRMIPFACAGRGARFRELVHESADELRALVGAGDAGLLMAGSAPDLITDLRIEDVERCRTYLAFIAAAYSRCDSASGGGGGADGEAGFSDDSNAATTILKLVGDTALPDYVSAPLALVSARLDRPRRLCYTDLVLYNWALAPEAAPTRKRTRRRKKSLSNLAKLAVAPEVSALAENDADGAGDETPPHWHQEPTVLLNRFLAVEEEDALWHMFISVERHSPAVVGSLLAAKEGMARDEVDGVVAGLAALRSALGDVVRCHDAHADLLRSVPLAARGEKVLMRRLRHFLFKAGTSDLDVACSLYTGDAALLPALFAFLGVGRNKASSLHKARDVAVQSRAMPKAHRAFCREMQAAPSARAFISGARVVQALPVHELAVLEAEFNGALDDLLRLCSRRSQLVCRYLPDYATDFRKHEFALERRAIQQARLSLLMQRRLGAPPRVAESPPCVPRTLGDGGSPTPHTKLRKAYADECAHARGADERTQ